MHIATGQRVPSALVERMTPNWRARLDATLTDSEGRFSFPGLSEGHYFVKVSKPGFDTVLVRVIVDREGTRELRLELQPSA